MKGCELKGVVIVTWCSAATGLVLMIQILNEPKSYWMATCNWHCRKTPSDREGLCTCYGSNRICVNNYVESVPFLIYRQRLDHTRQNIQHKVTALSNHLAASVKSMSISPVFIL